MLKRQKNTTHNQEENVKISRSRNNRDGKNNRQGFLNSHYKHAQEFKVNTNIIERSRR